MSRRRPTLAEVARQAGVSVSTVSKVVNGHLDVAAETRRHIEQLLEQHQYRHAAHLAAKPWGLIDLVFHDLDNSWAMQILAGVEEHAAHEHGVGVVVSAVRDDTDRSVAPLAGQRRAPGAPTAWCWCCRNCRPSSAPNWTRWASPWPWSTRSATLPTRSPRWAPRTGRAAWPPPSISSNWATRDRHHQRAHTTCCAAGPGWTDTAARLTRQG